MENVGKNTLLGTLFGDLDNVLKQAHQEELQIEL
jgi:hypothetical protein